VLSSQKYLTLQVVCCYLQGTALSGRLWMDNVWGTPDAPLIIQRDPAYGPNDPPSILEVVDIFNCTYVSVQLLNTVSYGSVLHTTILVCTGTLHILFLQCS
jgi:hypothetical protein